MTTLKPQTRILMGAAHYGLHMSVGDIHTYVDLAKELHGLPPRERYSRLSGVADIICKAHGITHAKPLPKPRSPKRTPKLTSMLMVLHREDISMEATL